MSHCRRAVAYISRSALLHNLKIIKKKAPHARIWAMLKCNAYGHDAVCVARVIQAQVDLLGVATLGEAISLRRAGITSPVIVMSGFLDSEELMIFDRYRLLSVVHQMRQVEWLESVSVKHALSIWLKIDSGMHRLGIACTETHAAIHRLSRCTTIEHPYGVMTHWAHADANEDYTRLQWKRFCEITQDHTGPRSTSNSAAILRFPEMHASTIRPGLILYGVSPLPGRTGAEEDLRPVMHLQAELIEVKWIAQGDCVGYENTWCAPEDMPIGLVSIGYGDGYPRSARNGTPVLVRNRVCPLIGRVSMDMLSIDLRSCPDAQIGDRVTLWGKELPVEIVAQWSNTVSYALLCAVKARCVECI